LSATHWQETDSEATSRGTELKNVALAKALESQVKFKKEEWDTFEVDTLSNNSYIKVGDAFFKPAYNNVIADMSFPHQQADKRGYREYGMGEEYNIQQHQIASVGITTIDAGGRMPEGKEKDMHSLTSVGIVTIDGRMPEGNEKDMHSLTSLWGSCWSTAKCPRATRGMSSRRR
jgi:hypothetical protein